MGDCETSTPVGVESPLGYHSWCTGILTLSRKPDKGQCQADSLTGAVASQRVTEAPKGTLRLDGNQSTSANAEACLTARQTGRAGTKVGISDPAVPNGRAVAQRIKATLGITGLSPPRVHIDGEVWHLDVGSSHPGAEFGSKGWGMIHAASTFLKCMGPGKCNKSYLQC